MDLYLSTDMVFELIVGVRPIYFILVDSVITAYVLCGLT